jgi:hypothetical protein
MPVSSFTSKRQFKVSFPFSSSGFYLHSTAYKTAECPEHFKIVQLLKALQEVLLPDVLTTLYDLPTFLAYTVYISCF